MRSSCRPGTRLAHRRSDRPPPDRQACAIARSRCRRPSTPVGGDIGEAFLVRCDRRGDHVLIRDIRELELFCRSPGRWSRAAASRYRAGPRRSRSACRRFDHFGSQSTNVSLVNRTGLRPIRMTHRSLSATNAIILASGDSAGEGIPRHRPRDLRNQSHDPLTGAPPGVLTVSVALKAMSVGLLPSGIAEAYLAVSGIEESPIGQPSHRKRKDVFARCHDLCAQDDLTVIVLIG